MAYNLNDVALIKHVNTLALLVKNQLDETVKYVSTSGNTVSFFTTADGSGTAAFTFDFPEEIFLDQVGTTLVENFSWSALSYPNSTNPNLNGKTVLVLAVKGDATTPTVKYSFVDLTKLIDTYTAADNSINISGHSVAVKISATTGNALSLVNDGLFVDTSDKVDKENGKGLSTEDYTTAEKNKLAGIDTSLYVTADSLSSALSGKVDNVAGKQLSSEDFTTAEKTKLGGISDGAQVNVIESVKVDNVALTPNDKAVNIDLSGKVDKVQNAPQGEIAIFGLSGAIAASGLSIADIQAGGTSYAVATSLESGLMSAADKQKLDTFNFADDADVGNMLAGIFGASSASAVYPVDNATSLNGGLMSAADKTKLDSIEFASDSSIITMLNDTFGAGSISSIERA